MVGLAEELLDHDEARPEVSDTEGTMPLYAASVNGAVEASLV